MFAIAGGIILAVIILSTIDWWLVPVLKIIGFLFTLAVFGFLLVLVATIAGG